MLTNSITPSRGIRQGDPLSPYIFVICAQGLSSLLKGHASHGSIKGLKMASRGPVITHLFFADDSLVFFKADPDSCKFIKESLESYEAASGQVVNFEKSALSFSPYTSQINQDRVKEVLRIRESRRHDFYLGVPSFTLRSRRVQFGYLRDKMARRVADWKHKHFTKGGKEVLIKSVLQAIPTFTMSCFMVPTSICKDMERICAAFWWEGSNHKNGIHWKSWEGLCRDKSDGGLGFRHLKQFNQALLAKQVWRMISRPDLLLCQVFKSRYFRSVDILNAQLGSSPSFVWRSILWGREIINEGLKWRVANGASISANCRNWISSWMIRAPSSCKIQNQKVEAYI